MRAETKSLESTERSFTPRDMRADARPADHQLRKTPRAVFAIALLAVALCVVFSYVYFHFGYFEECEVSYLFQAHLFAQGRIAAPAPPEMGFSTINANIAGGRWYSRYFFGNAMLLALGVMIGAPWIIPALATGAAVLILYRILLEVYGARTALVGALLALVSPATLVMGAVPYSEAINRLSLGLFLLATIRSLQRKSAFYAALAGAALGYGLNTRPLTAAFFGAAASVLWLAQLLKEPLGAVARRAAVFAATFLVGVGAMLAWNTIQTGRPLQQTFNAVQTLDGMGFGLHAEGYNLDPREVSYYSPQKGVQRAITKTIPAVGFTLLGWGYYHPLLNQALIAGSMPERVKILGGLALTLIVWLLLVIAVRSRSRNLYDVMFFLLPALNLASYFFLYGDGATWGNSPTETRYYTESMMFGMIPLVARGLFVAWEWMRGRMGTVAPAAATVAACALLANTAFTYAHFNWNYRGDGYWGLTEQVKAQGVHHAVVFVPGILAPLSDYPFESLEKADVVYFRLGPSKIWGVPARDPGEMYRKYFQGRRAFQVVNNKLVPFAL